MRKSSAARNEAGEDAGQRTTDSGSAGDSASAPGDPVAEQPPQVTRDELDAYIARFKDPGRWHYGERRPGELAGVWESSDGDGSRLIFGADGTFREESQVKSFRGLYAVSDSGRVVAVAAGGSVRIGAHFQLNGEVLTGPKGPVPNARWKRVAPQK